MKIKYFILIAFFLEFSGFVGFAAAEIRVGKIHIDRQKVFEPTDKDWFFAADFLNNFHTVTKKYIVQDEILFKSGDYVDDDLLYETERNLRRTGLFTRARIEIDSVHDDTYDIYINTKDRWSLYPSALFGSGGGKTNYGGRLEEFNLFGTGTLVSSEALFRNESNIGWQGTARLYQRKIYGTNLSIDFNLMSNKIRTEQNIKLQRDYLTLEDPMAYGVDLTNNFGRDFIFQGKKETTLIPMNEQKADFWFSRAWWRKDRVFITAWAEYQKAERGLEENSRAFDNSGKLLFAFSSVSQEFFMLDKVNSYYPEDVTIGGWGSAILGKVFPIASKGESYYYVAGQGERSYLSKKVYLFGQLTGASAFSRAAAYYTYQEFLGLGFYRITENLLLAANIRQQTVWNWAKQRQLILDNDAGLRGYDLNSFAGDNRMVSNVELRFFPNITAFLFNLSGVAFFDVGSVWRQDIKLTKAQFHNSAGLGLRLHFTKSDNPDHIFRIDFAYNFDEKRFGGIVFSTRQMFSAFKNHEFRLPKLFGTEFDYE